MITRFEGALARTENLLRYMRELLYAWDPINLASTALTHCIVQLESNEKVSLH